jgi:phage terminase large subunit GpA-like protein
MDAVTDPSVEMVSWMSSAQVGKTEVLLNIIGRFVENDPSPLLILQPTQKPMAEAFSKDRLAPMFRDTPCLTGLIEHKGRTGGDTILHKSFPGGHLTIAGANSPSNLASRPIRIVLADEIDRYPESAGAEGDPLALAEKRTTTFWNRKIVRTSTPTISGQSRIEASFLEGDQRHYEVPCPLCGEFQRLKWSQIIFDKLEDKSPDYKSVHYECAHCKGPIEEIEKRGMLLKGQWVADAPFQGHASFHISALYSPWMKWREVVKEWHQARGDHERMKVWTNTVLGEVFREEAREIDHAPLLSKREAYQCPNDVLVVVVSVDVQETRLELLAVGYGVNEQSWELETRVINGDTTLGSVWDDLRDFLQTTKYTRDDGAVLGIAGCGIDSGFQTKMVYEFCRRTRGRLFALKGVPGERAIVSSPARLSKAAIDLYTVGVDPAKDVIYSRIMNPGLARLHFSEKCDEEFFLQLTAEKAVLKKRRGFDIREWVKVRPRNEILDLYVYSLATLYILNPVWPALVKPKVEKPADEIPKSKRNWATTWR